MRLAFTKMHGAGNDFVVLDATRVPLALSADQVQRLADRRRGVGADQVLVVEASSDPGIDFRYRIYNGGSGAEVEHCGNGARCFVRYVHDKHLSDKPVLRVATVNNVLELRLQPDGRVTVDMNRPRLDPAQVPFDTSGLTPRDGWLWPLDGIGAQVAVAVLSMGNPHAVLRVDDIAVMAVATVGPRIECHPRFAHGANAGFMQVVSRRQIALRVWERGAGETPACGTGACAAVVAGIRSGWLDRHVDVHTAGGVLTVAWPHDDAGVLMTGPAATVFEGAIEL